MVKYSDMIFSYIFGEQNINQYKMNKVKHFVVILFWCQFDLDKSMDFLKIYVYIL